MIFVEFPAFSDPNGILTVFEGGNTVPFSMQRVFSVTAGRGSKRGDHSHIKCSQLIVCVTGRVRLSCSDGEIVEETILESSHVGVLIPPGIWATQEYLQDNSTILVFCDRTYEAEDYVRDYQEFLSMKAAIK